MPACASSRSTVLTLGPNDRRLSYQRWINNPSTLSKCRSRVTKVTPYRTATAAIYKAFSGTGRPCDGAPTRSIISATSATPRRLLVDDLDGLLTDDFYVAADYYFDGVLDNANADEHSLMQLLATREESWPIDALRAAVAERGLGLDLDATLDRLVHHDILPKNEPEAIRFAAELLRRWVARRSAES